MSSLSGELGESFPDRISEICLSKFKLLGKTGKPKDDGEFTLLACVVKKDIQCNLEVVALGTGSKCMGASQLPSNGNLLHDSHAEVIARRAFVLYLISEIDHAASGHASIFEWKDSSRFSLLPGVSFHFYSSHTPCGDASIFAKQEWNQDCCGEQIDNRVEDQMHKNEACDEPPYKKQKNVIKEAEKHPPLPSSEPSSLPFDKCCDGESSNGGLDIKLGLKEESLVTSRLTILEVHDIHRTGAKCVSGEKEDPKTPGMNYHVTGVLRTKPGRGDPTLSMSCSDKIFKWTVLGIQGALLMRQFLESPVYLQTVTIGLCPYSQDAVERALFGRFKEKMNNIQLPFGFTRKTPLVFQSSVEFPYSRSAVARTCKDANSMKPSPCSLIWSLTDWHCHKHEVSVNGCKLGTTKKNLGTSKSWVSICRQALLQRFLLLAKKTMNEECCSKSYSEYKELADTYQKAWDTLKSTVLCNWTSKPAFTKDFKIESECLAKVKHFQKTM